MITDCFGGASQHYLYGLEEGGFFLDVARLMILVIPGAIGYALWRIFVTNQTRPGGISVLDLDEKLTTYTEGHDYGISWRKLFIYGVTGVVFAFETFR